VITLMPDQANVHEKGGTMRLGAYACDIREGTLARRLYGRTRISERHRHRFEFNEDYTEMFSSSRMILSGRNPDRGLVEIVELAGHPFFIGVQYHPEFKSAPLRPHPIFQGFVAAALTRSRGGNHSRLTESRA
jgi:CTP synthase